MKTQFTGIGLVISPVLVAGIMGLAPAVLADSSSSVSILNSVNANSSSNNSNNSHTYIRIESNGQVKTLDTNQPGSYHLQSDNGDSTVNVNTDVGSNENTPNPTATPNIPNQYYQPTPTPIVSPTPPEVVNRPPVRIETNRSFFERIRLYIQGLFLHLHFGR